MKIAQALEAYLSQPIGQCLLGSTYAVFWTDPGLNGIILWDRPSEQDIHRITCALDAELAPGVAPHASLIDARRVRSVDLGAFNTLARYVKLRTEPFARLVTGQALLRPEGLAGAAIAGFYMVLAPSFPVRVFTDPAEALEWLGRADGAHLIEELERTYAAVRVDSSLVLAMRALLEQHRGAASIKDAAHSLQMSPRQLQRKLREAGTSFQSEEGLAKIRVAKTLLLETNYDIKRVAIDVGCASQQHFSGLFRKMTGETPTQWRLRRQSNADEAARAAKLH